MLSILKDQKDGDCFPSALPGHTIAHKTGVLANLYHDGGIIHNGSNDAILVIMTENVCNERIAIAKMRAFSRSVIFQYASISP